MKTPLMPFDFTPEQLSLKEPLDVPLNHQRLNQMLLEAKADALILTSKDPFISEYVSKLNHQRFGATGFKGSTGDCIFWSEKFRATHHSQKAVSLFVDGRYHLQADNETNSNLVEVVKLQVEPNIEDSIFERFSSTQNLKIALDPERVSMTTLDQLKRIATQNAHSLVFFSGEDILKALGLPGWVTDRPIFSIPEAASGRTPSKTLSGLNESMKGKSGSIENLHVTCSTDDASFLLNARGYHMPNQSSFFAYTFFAQDQMIIFLPAASKMCEVKITPADLGNFKLTIIRNSLDELKSKLRSLSVAHVFFNGGSMNGLLPSLLSEVFPRAKVNAEFKWIIQNRVSKTPQEMTTIRNSFLKSSRAIAKTLRYGKKETALRDISEKELSNYLYEAYREEGATILSFTTICGAGGNSAIVHYTSPQDSVKFKKGQMALLDSGAYYSEGFCTDCTRGFFVGTGSGAKPEAWQKEIYTATLRAAISVFLQPMDAKLTGKEVDEFVRSRVKAAGHDYLHGTGHGVGIHVHEEGIRFSTLSNYNQSPYACVSVEPGIYLKDQGGVRVENVVLLIPEGESKYFYENCAFVGYDWDLIDVGSLTTDEKQHLKSYEAKCRELGTQLMECPL